MPTFRQKPVNDIDGKKFPKPPPPSLKKFIQLLKYPPHLIVSINGALQFFGLYGIYMSFPRVWRRQFDFEPQEIGYAYLAPGISLFIASILTGRISDTMRQKAIKASPNGKVSPERRLPIQLFGFVIACCGKLLYGWTAQLKWSSPLGLLGSGLAAVGTAIIFVTSTSFQTECDPTQAASLVALGGLLRNTAAAIGAVIMDTLLNKLGYGWAFVGFAALDLLCIPGIILIMVRGKHFREQLNKNLKS
jgi:MFS family permease